MSSEIRVNKINNRAGLGTVTYADTGIIVSGIVTCTELSGLTALNIAGVGTASTLDINGDIDVDGHTNLDNVSIAGVSTFASAIDLNADLDVDGHTNLDNVSIAGVVTATSFTGSGANLTNLTASQLIGALPSISGANLTNLPPSAPVGGASTNTVFFENDKAVAVNYQITSTKNAMSAGPISINAGIAVTVPSGCSWTIV